MSLQLNKVTIAGYLGRDPRVETTTDGSAVASLTVATSEYWTDRQSGDKRERTEWHRIVIWNQYLVRLAKTRLTKGSPVYIEGKLETRRWQDQNGTWRAITEIVVRPWQGDMKILERARPQNNPAQNNPTQGNHADPDRPHAPDRDMPPHPSTMAAGERTSSGQTRVRRPAGRDDANAPPGHWPETSEPASGGHQ